MVRAMGLGFLLVLATGPWTGFFTGVLAGLAGRRWWNGQDVRQNLLGAGWALTVGVDAYLGHPGILLGLGAVLASAFFRVRRQGPPQRMDGQAAPFHLFFCRGARCRWAGGEWIEHLASQRLHTLTDKPPRLSGTRCLGLCEAGPVVWREPEGRLYSHVGEKDLDEMFALKGG
ncbi:hypothetical protein TPY_0612 [Sulfobacillus acidophilus TPY]|nr:hypothetical protein TPY_0612 [Sulfobacillus acidophilus TPY]